MHELAIAEAILDLVERHAEGRPVTVVRVKVGRLRQVVPEQLASCAGLAAELRPGCQDARFEWDEVPAALRCGACGGEWDPAPPPARDGSELIVRFRCPSCDSSNYHVVSGEELEVESIDVSEPALRAASQGSRPIKRR
jgi:hydrogenase nickel incorporation protein HypA/HybF